MQTWWQSMFNMYSDKAAPLRDRFESDWLRDRLPTIEKSAITARAAREHDAVTKKKEDADKEAQRKKYHAAYLASFPTLSNESLCDAVHIGWPPDSIPAREELQRRHAIEGTEWSLILEGKIKLGMSELGLACAWGPAPSNRTVTAAGIHRQYIYGDGTLVYTDNGRVTAWQDNK